MKQYTWWEGANSPPDHLKTKKQLAEIGLKPLNPVGFIPTRKYDLMLYDITDPTSVRPKKAISLSQQQALEKARQAKQFNQELKNFLEDEYPFALEQIKTISTASSWFQDENIVVFDTETTGLNNPEIIEIAFLNLKGEILFHQLFNPIQEISFGATNVHGYNNASLKNCPLWRDADFSVLDKNYKFIAYNFDFDYKAIKYTNSLHNSTHLSFLSRTNSGDLMDEYATYTGDWSNYWGDFKWQPLGGNHNAIGDGERMIEIIKEMATSKISLPAKFRSYIDVPSYYIPFISWD